MLGTNEQVERRIVEFDQAFHEKKAAIEDALPWARNEEEIERLKLKLAKLKNYLQIFYAVVEHLPDCLELDVLPQKSKRNEAERHWERTNFREHLRADFLIAVTSCQNDIDCLHEMGLSEEDIEHIRKYMGVPFVGSDIPYDITVEHLHDLSLGGNNDFENLCLLPDYLNFFKAIFHDIQKPIIDEDSDLLSFKPKAIGATIPRVPIIPGGFRIRNRYIGEIRNRVSQLFGGEIYFENTYQ